MGIASAAAATTKKATPPASQQPRDQIVDPGRTSGIAAAAARNSAGRPTPAVPGSGIAAAAANNTQAVGVPVVPGSGIAAAAAATAAASRPPKPDAPKPEQQPVREDVARQEAPTPNPPPVTISEEQLTDVLAFQGAPNPLSSLHQVAHRFRLFTAGQIDVTKKALEAKAATATAIHSIINGLPTITIAETGTTSYNIKDVQIDQIVGPNFQTRSTNQTKFTMTIVEPLGTSFLDAMKAAANELGAYNYQKVWYFLELKFHGYDGNDGSAGTYVENPVASEGYVNGGRWIWQISITNIDMKLDVGGGVYTLTAVPYGDTALDKNYAFLPAKMSVDATTVGAFLNDFANALTEEWRKNYRSPPGREVAKFQFELHDNAFFTAEQLKNMPLTPLEDRKAEKRSFDLGGGRAHLSKGTWIPDVLEAMFLHCEPLQKFNEEVVHATRGGKVEKLVPRVEPVVITPAFDYLHNLYQKDVTYHIWGFTTQGAVVSTDEVVKAKSAEQQAAMVNALLSKGLFKKRYDYIYTGLNTEVLDLDIRYNMVWVGTMPRRLGFLNNPSAVTDNELFNEEFNRYRTVEMRIMQLQSDIQKITDELAKMSSSDPRRRTQQSVLDSLNTELQISTGQSQIIQDSLYARTDELNRYQYEGPTNQKLFAEDMIGANSKFNELTIPIDMIQGYDEAEKAAGTGFTMPYHPGTSVFGAIMNQLYAPLKNALLNLDIEIRGDPYWIGPSNVDRLVHLRSSGSALDPKDKFPNFYEGDCVFLLSFKFPYRPGGQPDTEHASASDDFELRKQDIFTGLYRVVRATHKFNDGSFTSKLTANRLPLTDVLKKFGVSSVTPSASTPTVDDPNTRPGARPAGEMTEEELLRDTEESLRRIRGETGTTGSTGANGFDPDKAAKHLVSAANDQSTGKCARYVRQAIEAGGVELKGPRPESAKDYGGYLSNNGFKTVDKANYTPQKGDIVVIQPYSGGSPHGHISMYDGSGYVSDFKQRDFWGGPGYRNNQPPYQIYRAS